VSAAANTLAYHHAATITAIKRFITQATVAFSDNERAKLISEKL
jgi:hypothetical protein